jgi:hypothetical protein
MTCEEVPLVASYARKAFSSLKNAFRIARKMRGPEWRSTHFGNLRRS